MQENPRIYQQARQKITFHGSANPKEISQQCTPATHTEAVHCQGVLLGSSILRSLVNNVSANLCHNEYSKCPPVARMQAWRRLRL